MTDLVEWRIPAGTFGDIRRAEVRLKKAREIAPKALGPAYVQMYWLKNVGNCAEAIDLVGRTPRSAPGAATVRTIDLPRLIAEQRPLVIDAMTFRWGVSLPGAIGLKFSGLGGDFSDEAQERLGSKMRELTGGDATRPIVTVGWNSERFDGRNLALRLVALGYQRVYWYRGGCGQGRSLVIKPPLYLADWHGASSPMTTACQWENMVKTAERRRHS